MRLNKLKKQRMTYKEIVVPITEYWQTECLESIFGDEPQAILKYDTEDGKEVEYKLEVVLRRIIPESECQNDDVGDSLNIENFMYDPNTERALEEFYNRIGGVK